MKQRIFSPENPQGSPFMSAAVEANGTLYLSGQGSLEPGTGKYLKGTIEEETQRTLERIEVILKQAGLDRSHIVKCTSWLADLDDFNGYNETYRQFFAGVEIPPARSTVGSPLLRGIKVEIEAVAVRPES